MSIKDIVSEVLELPSYLYKYWYIAKTYPKENPHLALAHYTTDFDPYNRSHEPLSKVRGIIVDIVDKVVVSRMYGYTNEIMAKKPLESSGLDIVVTTNIPRYTNNKKDAPEEVPTFHTGELRFPKDKTTIHFGYDCALVRIFKWKGEVFFSTHRSIDGKKSRWGNAYFYEIYKELGGPDINTLDKEYHFILVDNKIRLATSTTDNRLILIGNGDIDVMKQPSIDYETANKFLFPSFYAKRYDSSEELATTLENEMTIDYNTGKDTLDVYFKPGSSNDPRMIGGDFIMMNYVDPNGVLKMYRVSCEAFEYREKVINNNPNYYNEFVVNTERFVKEDVRDILEDYPDYKSTDDFSLAKGDTKDKQVFWWSVYHDAIHPSAREEVKGFLKKYYKDIKRVAKFILKKYKFKRDMDINERVKQRFDHLISIVEMNSMSRNVPPLMKMESLLITETGKSFYKMIKTIDYFEKTMDNSS